jgi:GNAT superfamily N-acetyltransferase
MDPVVRRAVAGDCPQIARLELLARGAATDIRGGLQRLAECPPVADWAALIDAANTSVYVGVIDEVVVGYMLLVRAHALDRGLVTHAFVEAEARELGFGDTMLEHAIADTRAAGLAGIESIALPGDRETKNLFERAGMTARKITVYKSLGESPPPSAAE